MLLDSVREGETGICRMEWMTRIVSSKKEQGLFVADTELFGNSKEFGKIKTVSLCAFHPQKEKQITLAKANPEIRDGALCCHFEVNFINRALTDKLRDGKWEFRICYHTGPETFFEDVPLCEKSISCLFVLRYGTMWIRIFRNSQGRAGLKVSSQKANPKQTGS